MNIGRLIIAISLIWVSSEIILAVVKRSHSHSPGNQDKSSFPLLWITIAIAITGGVLLGIRGIGHIAGGSRWLPYLGFALIILGLIIRWIAIITLNRYFTVDVAVTENHQIVDQGFYRHIRHPAYTGSLLSFFGLGLTFSDYLTLIILFIPIAAVFMYRVRVEEAALNQAFGEKYAAYCTRTKRFIPLIY